jgi:DNA (cytosine-5)-methyltransferase 1
MKILNLYAGIGGNRKLWGNEHDITAVELDPEIAKVYQDYFPDDTVVIDDAHEYLLKNYSEYDFIWSSPPCPTHSRARFGFGVCGHGYDYVYPDMKMYQEIILLKYMCKDAKWCVENVLPYYDYLIYPSQILGRHAYWANFYITPKKFSTNNMIAGHTKAPDKLSSYRITGERQFLKKMTGFNLEKYTGIDKRKVLRNCVEPEAGLHILSCADNDNRYDQLELFNQKTGEQNAI